MKFILAHRGIVYKYKENTLKSLCEIKKYSNNEKITFGVEFDINLTKDNILILYHNEFIKNTDNKITELTFNQIELIDKDITLLSSVFDSFDNTEYFLDIEFKEYPQNINIFCDIFINLIKKYKNIKYFTSSFNKSIVDYLNNQNILSYLLIDKNILITNDLISNKYIIHYSNINNIKNKDIIGIYTLYDNEYNNNYNNDYSEIKIFITDDIDKLILLIN
jgi:glycerophosphoryl diester phosphodiesterase